jgi:hypothetical protein
LQFLFNFCMGYAIKNFQENKEGLELNGTHELLVYAHTLIYCVKTNITNKHAKALLDSRLN